MIARIKTENGYYDSIVFAIFKKCCNTQVIVFNENYDNLVLNYLYKGKVFIFNKEINSEWIEKKKVEGYDWVLKNVSKRFFKTVFNQSILDKCKELQSTVKYQEWSDIKTQKDIDVLMDCTAYFHDAYVKQMYADGEKQYILFDTTWGCEILFELDGNVQTNLIQEYTSCEDDENMYHEFFDSSMFIENNLIYWVDKYPVKSSAELDKSKLYYFCANNVKWKLIIS